MSSLSYLRHFLLLGLLGFCLDMNAQPLSNWDQFADPKIKTDTMLRYAYGLLKKQQLDPGISVLHTILPIAQQARLDSTAGACFYLLGLAYRYKSKNDSAFYYYERSKEIATRRQLVPLGASIDLEYYGINNRLGKADAATAALNRLKNIMPLLDTNSNVVPKIEMDIGHDEKHHLRYTEALVHYYKALRMFTRLKDSVNIGNIYISLANAYVDLDQHDKALNYHRQAAAILTLINRRTELINELLNITDMYYTSGQLDSGEVFARRALPIAVAIDDKDAQGYVYLSLGNIAKRKHNMQEAEDYLLKSIGMAGPLGNDNLLIECYQGLGELYMSLKLPARAKSYLEQHLALAKKNDDLQEMIEAVWDLSENEFALQHYASAFAYKNLYSTYRDSSFRASSVRSNAEMESRYQSEKKEKEIELLKKDQALKAVELRREKTVRAGTALLAALLLVIGLLFANRYRILQKAKRLVEIERLRNGIARDLHDDIGSALSSININSNMALDRSGEMALVKKQLEKISASSGKIMERMGDIVWAIDPGNDAMSNLSAKMKEFLAEILEPLDISYQVNARENLQQQPLSADKRKSIYMIFKEAVNNAAKYSRCKNVSVSIQKEGERIELSVTDNGIGFDAKYIKPGNGLFNMRERAIATGGELQVVSTPGTGTTVLLKIPVT